MGREAADVAGLGKEVGKGTEAFWRGHVAAWSQTRLSVRGYCRRHGLSEPSFIEWRNRMECLVPRSAAQPVAVSHASPLFAEVRLPAAVPESPSPIAVALPSGVEVRVVPGFDADTLARVLDTLERRAC